MTTTSKPDRTIAPAAYALEEITLPAPKKITLKNGLELYAIDRGDAELIRVELVFGLGDWDESRPIRQVAAFRLLSEGTSSKTSAQIADEIDFYGSFYQVNVTADYAVITVYSLRKHLEKSLSILNEMLQEAAYPVREIETFKENSIQKLKVEKEKTGYLAGRAFHSLLFGQNHPYGYSETETDYERLDRDSLVDYFRRFLSEDRAFALLSGKVKDQDVALFEKHLGSGPWRDQKSSAATSAPGTGSDERDFFIERPDSLQSSIRIGRAMFPKNHPDYAGMQVLSTILGGYFGSRLMANIREDKGYTYGVHAALGSHRHAGFFSISTDVGSEYTRETVKEILKEIKILREQPVPGTELSLVRNYLTGSFQSSLENAFSYADKFKAVHLFGLDTTYYSNYFKMLRETSPEKLRELAVKYLQDEALHVVIAGRKR